MNTLIDLQTSSEPEPDFEIIAGKDNFTRIASIRGIAQTLDGPLFDEIKSDSAQRLIMALHTLARELEENFSEAPDFVEVRDMLKA